jgi:hypothetical protein
VVHVLGEKKFHRSCSRRPRRPCNLPCLQSTLMDTICSVAATHLPHSMINLRHANTTNSGSQVQAVEENFSGKCDILVIDGAHKIFPRHQHKYWHWSGLDTLVHVYRKDYPSPMHDCCGLWTYLHTHAPNTLNLFTELCVKWAHSQRVVVATRKIAFLDGYHQEPNERWAGRSVRSSLFWDVTHLRLMVSYLRFGTNY